MNAFSAAQALHIADCMVATPWPALKRLSCPLRDLPPERVITVRSVSRARAVAHTALSDIHPLKKGPPKRSTRVTQPRAAATPAPWRRDRRHQLAARLETSVLVAFPTHNRVEKSVKPDRPRGRSLAGAQPFRHGRVRR